MPDPLPTSRPLDIAPWFPDPLRRRETRDAAAGTLISPPVERRTFLSGIVAFAAFATFVAFGLGILATSPVNFQLNPDLNLFEKILGGFGSVGGVVALLWATWNVVAGALEKLSRIRTLVAGSNLHAGFLRLVYLAFAATAAALLFVSARAALRLTMDAYAGSGAEGTLSFVFTSVALGWCALFALIFAAEFADELRELFAIRGFSVPGPLRTRPAEGGSACIAHWSDLHLTAGDGVPAMEGKTGVPLNGNVGFRRVIAEHADALGSADMILVTGDVTDAGRGAEWRAFFDLLPPAWAARMVLVPGNHDLNIIDSEAWTGKAPRGAESYRRPSRLIAFFCSGEKGEEQFGRQLRVVRFLAALDRVQGERTRIMIGPEDLVPLRELLTRYEAGLKEFITDPPARTFEEGSMGLRETTSPRDRRLLQLPHLLMNAIFPCVVEVPGTPL